MSIVSVANTGNSATNGVNLRNAINAATTGDIIEVAPGSADYDICSGIAAPFIYPAIVLTVRCQAGNRTPVTEKGLNGASVPRFCTNGATINGCVTIPAGATVTFEELDFTTRGWPTTWGVDDWDDTPWGDGSGNHRALIETETSAVITVSRCRFYKGYGPTQLPFDPGYFYEEVRSPPTWWNHPTKPGWITDVNTGGQSWPGWGASWPGGGSWVNPSYNTIIHCPNGVYGLAASVTATDCWFHDLAGGLNVGCPGVQTVTVRRCAFGRIYVDSFGTNNSPSYPGTISYYGFGNLFYDGWGHGKDASNPHSDNSQILSTNNTGTLGQYRFKVQENNSAAFCFQGVRAVPQMLFWGSITYLTPQVSYGPKVRNCFFIGPQKAIWLGANRNAYIRNCICLTPEWADYAAAGLSAGVLNHAYANGNVTLDITDALLSDSIIEGIEGGAPVRQFASNVVGLFGTSRPPLSTYCNSPSTIPTTFEGMWTAFKPNATYATRGPQFASLTAMIESTNEDFTGERVFCGIRPTNNAQISTATSSAMAIICGGDPGDMLTLALPAGVTARVMDEDRTTILQAYGNLTSVPVGKYLQLQWTTGAAYSTTVIKTFTLGGVSHDWPITTRSNLVFPKVSKTAAQEWNRSTVGALGAADGTKLIFACQVRVDSGQSLPAQVSFFAGTASRFARGTIQPSSTKYTIAWNFSNSGGGATVANALSPALDFDVDYIHMCSFDLTQSSFPTGFIGQIIKVSDGSSPGPFVTGGTWTVGGPIGYSYAHAANGLAFFRSVAALAGQIGFMGMKFNECWTVMPDTINVEYIGSTGKGLSPTGAQPEVFIVGKTTVDNLGPEGAAPTGGTWILGGGGSLTDVNGAPWPPVLSLISEVLTPGPYTVDLPIDILVTPVGRNDPLNVTGATDKSGTWATNPQAMAEASNGVQFTYTPHNSGSHSITFTASNGYVAPAPLVLAVTDPYTYVLPGAGPTVLTRAQLDTLQWVTNAAALGAGGVATERWNRNAGNSGPTDGADITFTIA